MIKVNGAKMNYSDVSLDDAILDRTIAMNFLLWLHDQYCSENLTFWLETQNYKYIFDEDDIAKENESIYERYLGGEANGLNIDDPLILNEFYERRKVIDRTTFMGVQNVIWALLRLESFPRFRAALGKNIAAKMGKKEKKRLRGLDEFTIGLYDKFTTLTNLAASEGSPFSPTTLPYDQYDEHIHQNLPDIEELWMDKDMTAAFREFLYIKASEENLSFYLAAVCFKYIIDDEDLEKQAHDIYDYYINPETASLLINVDHLIKLKIQKTLKGDINRDIFDRVIARVFKSLKNEWLPEFLVSDTYQKCNNNEMEYTYSDPDLNSRTMKNYTKFRPLFPINNN
eukprot:TRINITY_DN110_c0_g4_i4.p1 TRINITY_DN110_c0_g4~~TRINITY_DN110_c0_g4_i4.p1  ORF type:complete len:341 (-),score=69.29 TRINITY_DN110_c0_g4_i4:94-1116(-)